jgi:hypothetical protein
MSNVNAFRAFGLFNVYIPAANDSRNKTLSSPPFTSLFYSFFASFHCFNRAKLIAKIPLVVDVEDMCAASCWIRLEAVELIVSLNSRVDEEGTRRASIASVQGWF